ncbi:MAG: hypothetical protein HZB26_01000 [Candidatus Hydrogenedentes bacterium]|nr:hypothetical protein [Candidatus Hydrogenedentota bacterium]
MMARAKRAMAPIGLFLIVAFGAFWDAANERALAEEAAPAGAASASPNESSASATPVVGAEHAPAALEEHAEKAPQTSEGAPAKEAAPETPAGHSDAAEPAPGKPEDAEAEPANETEMNDGAPKAAAASGAKSGRVKRNGKPRNAQAPANELASDAQPKGPNFDLFRIVVDRNIFSSKRVPKTAEAKPDDAAKPQAKALRLMGTYLTPERTLALFEGTDEIPGGGIQQGETIAGYRVEEVRVDAAVLINDKGKIEVPVGSGLAKNDDGTWTLVDKPAVEPPAAAPDSGDAASAPSGAKSDDPVEKLRARRRKELGQ